MRSTRILIAILVVLIPIAGTVYYLRYKTAAERETRWQTMEERGGSSTAVNGPMGTSHVRLATQAEVEAIPAPVQVAGPVAETKKIELAWTDTDGTQGVLRDIDGCVPAGELTFPRARIRLHRPRCGPRRGRVRSPKLCCQR